MIFSKKIMGANLGVSFPSILGNETPKLAAGFTLVELLVSIGIFMIMTGIVLANYRNYNTNANFANASEDIVLAIRQAQVYGVSQKGQSNTFNVPYGVYFDNHTPNKNKIILFADMDSDGKYTSAPPDTIVQTISWQNPIGITNLECQGTFCSGDVLSVIFKRPSPDAIITAFAPGALTYAKITIGNGGTKTSVISITESGQISLQ